MASQFPIKRIEPVTADIKMSGINYSHLPYVLDLSRLPSKIFRLPTNFWFKRLLISGIIVFLISSGFLFSFNFKNIKDILLTRTNAVSANFFSSFKALREFNPSAATISLKENQTILGDFEKTLKKYGNQLVLNFFGRFFKPFQSSSELVQQISQLNQAGIRVAEILDELSNQGFYYWQNDGETLLTRLKELRILLSDINKKSELVQNNFSELKKLVPALTSLSQLVSRYYLDFGPALRQWDKFLEALIDVLDRPEDVHFLILFQNPAEIRPAGGFLGSYADMILRRGRLYQFDVRDIYDPDGQFDLKIIPPEPLQTIVSEWRPRDANWFFDFPLSAAKVIDFLEASKMYKEQEVKFEGVIALNNRLIESLLEIIGPVFLPDYGLEITKDNFMIEVQREVEAGLDKKAGQPKKILRVLTPFIIERLNQLNENQKKTLIDKILYHFSRKDIMVFAKNSDLREFLRNSSLDGSVASLPHNFWGVYLAVVNANLGGGKSDYFIEQSLELETMLDIEGGILNTLSLSRTHNGNQRPEPWWRKTNQDYFQIFINPNSTLVSIKGNEMPPRLVNKINYDVQKFQVDEDVKKIEDSRIFFNHLQVWLGEAFGKNFISGWLTLPAGKTKILEMRYQIPALKNSVLADGKKFRLFFEKQSGIDTRLKINVLAPWGYYWEETQDSRFQYKTESMNSRLIIDLTLRRNLNTDSR